MLSTKLTKNDKINQIDNRLWRVNYYCYCYWYWSIGLCMHRYQFNGFLRWTIFRLCILTVKIRSYLFKCHYFEWTFFSVNFFRSFSPSLSLIDSPFLFIPFSLRFHVISWIFLIFSIPHISSTETINISKLCRISWFLLSNNFFFSFLVCLTIVVIHSNEMYIWWARLFSLNFRL